MPQKRWTTTWSQRVPEPWRLESQDQKPSAQGQSHVRNRNGPTSKDIVILHGFGWYPLYLVSQEPPEHISTVQDIAKDGPAVFLALTWTFPIVQIIHITQSNCSATLTTWQLQGYKPLRRKWKYVSTFRRKTQQMKANLAHQLLHFQLCLFPIAWTHSTPQPNSSLYSSYFQ